VFDKMQIWVITSIVALLISIVSHALSVRNSLKYEVIELNNHVAR
jgi:hypothetical protein